MSMHLRQPEDHTLFASALHPIIDLKTPVYPFMLATSQHKDVVDIEAICTNLLRLLLNLKKCKERASQTTPGHVLRRKALDHRGVS